MERGDISWRSKKIKTWTPIFWAWQCYGLLRKMGALNFVKGRTIWYESLEQMQTDLDRYLEHYNTHQPHQGRMMEGQTPTACSRRIWN